MSKAKHTPGPWQWFERMPGRPYLATPDRGQLYVLGFERKGMQGAGPVFAHWPGLEGGAERERKGGIMESGPLLRDGSMHPDARLIAAAPELLEALQALVYEAEALRKDMNELFLVRGIVPDKSPGPIEQARAAIAKATGEQP